jgi:hypothetical protein
LFYIGEKAGQREFPFAGNDIICIFCHLVRTCGRVGASDNRYTFCTAYLISEEWFIEGVEAVTGHIRCRLIDRRKLEAFLFTCRRESGKGVPGCMDLPPVHVHNGNRSKK